MLNKVFLLLKCDGVMTPEFLELSKEILQWFYILAPITVVLLVAFDYGKAVISQDVSELKKVASKMMKRFLAAIFLFVIPWFVTFLLGITQIEELLIDKDCIISSSDNTISQSNDVILLTPSFEYSSVKLPDGTFSTYSDAISYKVSQNGTYVFSFYDEDNHLITETRYVVANIDTEPPSGTCTYELDKISVQVTDSSGIVGYSYYDGNNFSSFISNHIFTVGSNILEPKVKVKDKAGNVAVLHCEVITYDAPGSVHEVTVEQVRQAIVDFAIHICQNNQKDFIYSGYYKNNKGETTYASKNGQSYVGKRFSGIRIYGTTGHQIYSNGQAGRSDWSGKRFVMECIGFCNFTVRHATKLGKETYSNFYNGFGFQSVSKKELIPGDILHFTGHYAIYVGKINGKDKIAEIMNSTYPYAWTIRLADLSKSRLQSVSRFMKVPSNINYNKVTSEATLWAKLDTVSPVIENISINDDKTLTVVAYDMTGKELYDTNGNGINGYTITRTSDEPVTWTPLSFSEQVEKKKQISFRTSKLSSGDYYVWVKDRGGNVSYKTVSLGC